MNNFLCIASIIVISTSQLAAQQKVYNTINKNASIEITYDTVDFGIINAGDSIKAEFEIFSTGTDTLIIRNVHATCGCTVPNLPVNELPPGQKTILTVWFRSKGKSGRQQQTIFVYCNTVQSPLTLHLTGSVSTESGKPPHNE